MENPFGFSFSLQGLFERTVPFASKIERQRKRRKIPGIAEEIHGRKNPLFHIDFSGTSMIKFHRCKNSKTA